MDIVGGSTSASPCSSYQQSPFASYNSSPASSSFPSPASSSYITNLRSNADGNSLIPWLKNLSSASSKLPNHYYMHNGSISAPVTSPLNSPTPRSPSRIKTHWDDSTAGPAWGGQRFSYLPSSTPASPGRQVLRDSGWIPIPNGAPASPTFSLVSSNIFGFKDDASAGGGSRMWTPGQSRTCSPAVAGPSDHIVDVPLMADGFADEFAFGSNVTGLVKAWEGERIHEECGSDELELTLGSSRARELYSNKISGTIPSDLGNLTSLVSLDLYLNNFSGPIPDTLGKLTKLRFLQLNNNSLSSSISTSLTTITALQVLTKSLKRSYC